MNRVFNFSAGPSMLPVPVLEKAASELVCYGDSGMSVMEMSHRSPVYEEIIADAQAKLIETLKCHTCSGSGTIVTGNPTACSACGGVGTQYIPNAYFDTALNMWMGQTIACAGCGGSGQIGVGGTVACGTCGGIGLLFG